MLFFLIYFFSIIMFLSKSLSLKPLPSWANEMRLLSFDFYKESLSIFLQWLTNSKCTSNLIRRIPSRMFSRKKVDTGLVEMEETEEMTILDLPELTLDHILSHLSPVGLCNVAGVCRAMRDMCRNDHLWETHMRQKWGQLIGPAARRQWQCYIASENNYGSIDEKPGWSIGSLSSVLPISWLRSMIVGGRKLRNSLPVDSVMSWYLSLEGGRFWFPAQVYNRENGHYGFMLSCYDAEITYDRRTDTFLARYPPHGRRLLVVEDGIQWNRVRSPPVETSAHDLHISEKLTDLCPGDHIEIQWRRNKEFPYGWWYGVVGHLETCDGTYRRCFCHKSDTVVLDFSQYSLDSPWRRTSINRKDHREEGNEAGGFYGGVRRLQSKEEISMWRRLWPTELLD